MRRNLDGRSVVGLRVRSRLDAGEFVVEGVERHGTEDVLVLVSVKDAGKSVADCVFRKVSEVEWV